METENWSVRVLVDAKTEYTKQLLDLLTPRFYEGIVSIYEDSKRICHTEKDPNILITFQQLLRSIPKWNQKILETEYNRIIQKSNCDFLEDLITAIFVANTKILTTIKTDQRVKQHKLDLSVPNGHTFIHKCYVQIAREFWKNPYLFDDTSSSCDIQRNMRDSYSMIDKAVTESIRKQLPVRHILKEYLGEIVEEDDNEDIESVLTKSERNNLKKMVTKDISENRHHLEQLKEDYQNYEYEKNSQVSQEDTIERNLEHVITNTAPEKNENIELECEVKQIENENKNCEQEHEQEHEQEQEHINRNYEQEQINEIASITEIINENVNDNDNDNKSLKLTSAIISNENGNGNDNENGNENGNENENILEITTDHDPKVMMVNPDTDNNQSDILDDIISEGVNPGRLTIDTELANRDNKLEMENVNLNITKTIPSESFSDTESKRNLNNVEIKSVIINSDTTNQISNSGLAIKRRQQLENLSDTSSSDEEIDPIGRSHIDNTTIKTVNLELVPNKQKTKGVKKPRSMGYAFYD